MCLKAVDMTELDNFPHKYFASVGLRVTYGWKMTSLFMSASLFFQFLLSNRVPLSLKMQFGRLTFTTSSFHIMFRQALVITALSLYNFSCCSSQSVHLYKI